MSLGCGTLSGQQQPHGHANNNQSAFLSGTLAPARTQPDIALNAAMALSFCGHWPTNRHEGDASSKVEAWGRPRWSSD
jgi:hypothetical protein